MPLLTIYFQLHQPFRLHPDRNKFLWEEKNREIFTKVAEKCYLPATYLFTELLKAYPQFKITMSMSGVFLEQAENYEPRLIQALQRLVDAGQERGQIEFLDETYYHSLTSLFEDPAKREFRDQVSLHRDKIRRLFGFFPTAFRNTELMYNNNIAAVVADMGYRAILCEKRDDMFDSAGTPISPNAVFRAKGTNLIVLPRHRELSDDVAFRFPHRPLSPDLYVSYIAGIDGEAVLLGFDYEHIGEHIWADRGIFEFWRDLPAALAHYPAIVMANPTEVAAHFQDVQCPTVDIDGLATSSWADATRDTFGWLGNMTQYELFKDIEGMEADARKAGGELMTRWRHLTTSDHVYFLHESIGEDHAVHAYFNPYGGSISQPTYILTRKIDQLLNDLQRFEIIKRKEKTAVLIITPETGPLPEEMGDLAKYISGKSGGQGEVVSALCEGMTERGIHVHLVTLNLKRRFQRECNLDEWEWREQRYKLDPKRIHLVSSAVFADSMSAYAGNQLLTAAEFQREIVNNVIKTVRAQHQGKLILHSHDWMAGGIIAAYAKETGLPLLHTVHNVFTANLPVEYLGGVNWQSYAHNLYFTVDQGRECIDCQATAIKNATVINFVGERFLKEVVDDYFLDRPIIPPSVRREVQAKFHYGAAQAIINAPASQMYPENCPHLVRTYGVDDEVLAAKEENRREFQRRLGLNIDPGAILFYWPSRLDPFQKGVELLEGIAKEFVNAYPDVQIAIVGDGVGNDRTHVDILGRIAYSSGGRIAYQPFSESLSMLGYAAASDVFGASLYEPCGQIDQVGNLFGATATNRDTGGYHDKIRELRLKEDGAPQDVGNGFLFRDYDTGGLWYALDKSVRFHRKPREVREAQIKRIMRQARERYDLGTMIAEYIRIYERLNGDQPLS
ncbi:MAG TPA: glycogen/starch synthase [Syntrophales bacterium]|jgi:glycogen synthase|nr:glycogen/starch synthase [Syntrophales bacterium]HOU76605.1 glycogen/starch synthase [Syntrophales bacterium]HPC31362.1 glycogen/starch synthase [Syntrophales bacterium]HQG33268.1 glycogen/starch synthase [Syntrophales bacterium]HQI35044.1 glycogen/starch synthase [Syntrophales bacterium]